MVKITSRQRGPGGFELPAGRPTMYVPESRLLVMPLRGTPPKIGSYTLKSGKGYSISKRSGASLIHGVDLAEFLADARTSLVSVVISSARGITATDEFVQGTVVGALISGLAEHEGATNSVTFLFTCADSQQDSVTIYFERD